MTKTTEFTPLINLMQAEQRRLLEAAAKAGQVPPANVLARIADLELAIGAAEHLQDEGPEQSADAS